MDPPDLGDRSELILNGSNERFQQIPFERIHGWADYWALRDVEVEHVERLARQNGLTDDQGEELKVYWLDRVEARLDEKLQRFRFRHLLSHRRSWFARHIRWNWLYQLWSNTVGPGARTWFRNRYVPIRRFTFRIRWRP